MIKLPEPVAGVFSKFGDPEAFGERELEVLTDLRKIPYRTKLYTEAQLKQAVRDALNLAADTCESTLYVNGDGTVSVFGPKTDANVEIRKCRDAIHALIKEIEA